MKQDKGRGVVILNKDKYTEKCLTFVNSNQFQKCDKDSTHTIERKIQDTFRKVKDKLPGKDYQRLYPTGSSPGKFYGTAKIHKITKDGTANDLPLRPIISNVGTASYNLAKHLAKLLSPLGKSEYTIESTKDFVSQLKKQRKPRHHKMISFDVSALFTSVPLDYTIDIVMRRIYDNNEIETNIPKEVMKELLLLCTKSVIFSFNNELYNQTDGVAMGSPLGPVLANIFMVELERKVIPKLRNYMTPWKRYVDDTIAWIKPKFIEKVTQELNNFHKNIKFTHELQDINGKISFLDVLIIIGDTEIETTVFRKPTNNDIYLHWDSFAPHNWKTGTIKTLFQRAFMICSTEELLRIEINYLYEVFTKINGYPYWLIKKIHNETKEMHDAKNKQNSDTNLNNENVIEQTDQNKLKLMLPYQGKQGENLIKSVKNVLKNIETPQELQVIYTGTKLSTQFKIKDRTKKIHQHDLVYKVQCPNKECNATYIGETARRLNERLKDHQGRDNDSHVLKHTIEEKHPEITLDDITILIKNHKTYYKRKILESLYIKRQKPNLNCQNKSIPLMLFY